MAFNARAIDAYAYADAAQTKMFRELLEKEDKGQRMKIKLERVTTSYKIIEITRENSKEVMEKNMRGKWGLHSVGDDPEAEDQTDNLIALCANCLYPVLEGDDVPGYRTDSEGVCLCGNCVKNLKMECPAPWKCSRCLREFGHGCPVCVAAKEE